MLRERIELRAHAQLLRLLIGGFTDKEGRLFIHSIYLIQFLLGSVPQGRSRGQVGHAQGKGKNGDEEEDGRMSLF